MHAYIPCLRICGSYLRIHVVFRMYYRKPQYFVTYQGYDVSDGQWIYRKDLLDDCPDLVTQADARFNYQPPRVHTPPAIR